MGFVGCCTGVSGAGNADFCVGEEREGSGQGGWGWERWAWEEDWEAQSCCLIMMMMMMIIVIFHKVHWYHTTGVNLMIMMNIYHKFIGILISYNWVKFDDNYEHIIN